MAERVDETTLTHPVRLICQWEHLRRARGDSLRTDGIWILELEGDTDCRRPRCFGARRTEIGRFACDTEVLTGDP